jgi:hypothetical protein
MNCLKIGLQLKSAEKLTFRDSDYFRFIISGIRISIWLTGKPDMRKLKLFLDLIN